MSELSEMWLVKRFIDAEAEVFGRRDLFGQ